MSKIWWLQELRKAVRPIRYGYHGTKPEHIASIQATGLNGPLYFGDTYDVAQFYGDERLRFPYPTAFKPNPQSTFTADGDTYQGSGEYVTDEAVPPEKIEREDPVTRKWVSLGLRKDIKDFTQTGEELGSNPGGTFADRLGQRHYFKFQPTNDHAHNEILAHKLYNAAGVQSLDLRPLKLQDGSIGTGAKWVKTTPLNIGDPDHAKQARKLFALHAWLGNWDHHVHGNMGMRNGKIAAMDLGGALLFRAQGAPKPNFGASVDEWDSLRQHDHKRIFHGMTPQELQESAGVVGAVDDKTIDNLVKLHGPGNDVQKGRLAGILKARRQDVLRRASQPLGKAEDLDKMAISDHPVGKVVHQGRTGNGWGSYSTHDYTHLLHPSVKDKYLLHLSHIKQTGNHELLRVEVKTKDGNYAHGPDGRPAYHGWINKDGKLEIDSLFSNGMVGMHLGRSALRAMQIHAANHLGTPEVVGQTVSPSAIRTHQAIAREEGHQVPDISLRQGGKYAYTTKSEFPETQAVTVWVMDPQHRTLWGKRRKDGKWALPGGHLDEGESPATAAVRELKEETGLDPASPLQQLGAIRNDSGVVIHLYRGYAKGSLTNTIDPDREFLELKWVDCFNGIPPDIAQNLAHPDNAMLRWLGHQSDPALQTPQVMV